MNDQVTVRVGRRTLRLSNLDKVLYPQAHFVKGQVIDYYRRIAPAILPHLRSRPLTLKRYPNGTEAPFFYEKRCPAHRPDWVETACVHSRRSDENVEYCLVHDEASLIWVANLASIELHTLLSRTGHIDRPTAMVFDLDPGEPATIRQCIPVALRMRELLERIGLKSFPKTSGGKGLHLYVPLNTPATFAQTKTFSQELAKLLERDDPAHITTNMRKDLRGGRIFIDWSQNDQHKTTVCAYSLRARAMPTVSTPIAWEEFERSVRRRSPELLQFTAAQVLDRVDRDGDLFAPVLKLKQRLPALWEEEVARCASDLRETIGS